ncbi:hypothetical protein ABZZ04_06560 [Streptomyces sp. NPDC006435]|uniref:hypothetical protein n=1 Tax=Streptomyces sp. NPDC006435 TaxID=3154300 RepID=UPI0033B9FAF4
MTVPSQPDSGEVPPLSPHGKRARSEITRLLCAGVYLQPFFRHRVVKELVEHDERAVAPSADVDVETVLAHALRAGRLGLRAGRRVAFLWVLFLVVDLGGGKFGWMTDWSLARAYDLTAPEDGPERLVNFVQLCPEFMPDLFDSLEPGKGTWVLAYSVVSVLMWLVQALSRRFDAHTGSSLPLGNRGVLMHTLFIPGVLLTAYWWAAVTAVWNNSANWAAVVFPLLLSVPVRAHRRAVGKVLRERFDEETFGQQPREEVTGSARLQSIGEAIRQEQHSRIALYDLDHPFAGQGQFTESWSLVMDLEPKPGTVVSDPVTTPEALDAIRQKVADLARTTGATRSRDRLGEVEIDEMVCLPAGPPRHRIDHREATTTAHLVASAGEGGEARRHFLRVRLSAWDSQMVVSVLVRVHTQGELLALEVAPHVLAPLKPKFRLLDDIIERDRDLSLVSAVQTLLAAPAASLAAVFSAADSARSCAVRAKGRFKRHDPLEVTPSNGPRTSVREMASQQTLSPFQAMDAERYLRTLQERIGTGLLQLLDKKGYDTKELKQQVVQVNSGGVYISSMQGGAVATGRGATARNIGRQSRRRSPASPQGR